MCNVVLCAAMFFPRGSTPLNLLRGLPLSLWQTLWWQVSGPISDKKAINLPDPNPDIKEAIYTLFQSQRGKKNTQSSGTFPYSPYVGVFPPGFFPDYNRERSVDFRIFVVLNRIRPSYKILNCDLLIRIQCSFPKLKESRMARLRNWRNFTRKH